jgi:hypothetical protein
MIFQTTPLRGTHRCGLFPHTGQLSGAFEQILIDDECRPHIWNNLCAMVNSDIALGGNRCGVRSPYKPAGALE